MYDTFMSLPDSIKVISNPPSVPDALAAEMAEGDKYTAKIGGITFVQKTAGKTAKPENQGKVYGRFDVDVEVNGRMGRVTVWTSDWPKFAAAVSDTVIISRHVKDGYSNLQYHLPAVGAAAETAAPELETAGG